MNYGLFIIGDYIYPEIHAFKTVDAAYAFANEFIEDNGIEVDNNPTVDENGFYISGEHGYTTFECRKLNVHE